MTEYFTNVMLILMIIIITVCLKAKHWHAQVRVHKITTNLGRFHSEVEAATVYDDFCIKEKLDRELNFPKRAEAAKHVVTMKGRSSKFTGVSWCKGKKKWRTNIKVKSKNKHLGYFYDEDDAAKAYDAGVRMYYPDGSKPKKWRGWNVKPTAAEAKAFAASVAAVQKSAPAAKKPAATKKKKKKVVAAKKKKKKKKKKMVSAPAAAPVAVPVVPAVPWPSRRPQRSGNATKV